MHIRSSYLDVLNACGTRSTCLMKAQEEDEKRESKQMLAPPKMNLGGRIFTFSNGIFGLVQLLFQGWFRSGYCRPRGGTSTSRSCWCCRCASNFRLLYFLLLTLLRISSRLVPSCSGLSSSHSDGWPNFRRQLAKIATRCSGCGSLICRLDTSLVEGDSQPREICWHHTL